MRNEGPPKRPTQEEWLKMKEGLILTFEQTEELEIDGKKIKILPVCRWMVQK